MYKIDHKNLRAKIKNLEQRLDFQRYNIREKQKEKGRKKEKKKKEKDINNIGKQYIDGEKNMMEQENRQQINQENHIVIQNNIQKKK